MGRRRSRPASHRRSLSARESADAGNQVGTWSADLIWGVAETYRVPISIIGTSSDATVYVRGHDVVLAYRGTSEDPEWVNDILGGVWNVNGEESFARSTASRVAAKYAAQGYDVHITGHSLGGYLAQAAAAEFLGTSHADGLASVEYFNGMGLDYALWAGLVPTHAEDRGVLEDFADRTGGARRTPHLRRSRLLARRPFGFRARVPGGA